MKAAVIIARGGSKRIPNKNIRKFFGKPLIAYPIEVAFKSKLFERVIVSTDSSDIACIAKNYGAEIPFMRPNHLADDHATTVDVMSHAAQFIGDNYSEITSICCLYPNPFIQKQDLQRCDKVIDNSNWEYLISATEYPSSIFRSFECDEQGGIHLNFPQHILTRTQDLPRSYYDAAQFYWGRKESWLNKKQLFSKNSCPIILPSWRVRDIDEEKDWIEAELRYELMLKRLSNKFRSQYK